VEKYLIDQWKFKCSQLYTISAVYGLRRRKKKKRQEWAHKVMFWFRLGFSLYCKCSIVFSALWLNRQNSWIRNLSWSVIYCCLGTYSQNWLCELISQNDCAGKMMDNSFTLERLALIWLTTHLLWAYKSVNKPIFSTSHQY